MRVFIVEDEALVAMELADRLSELGYAVVGTVARGEAALAECPGTRPDVVLMDVHLSGKLDGVMTAERLRPVLDAPVVFLTAYSDDAVLQRALATGPAAYLVKPFDIRELHATLQAVFYKHQYERSLRDANRRLEEQVRLRTASLAASEARLVEAQRIAQMGDWELDLATGAIFWSAPLYRIFGRDPEAFRPTLDAYFSEIVHPDDEADLRIAYQEVLESGEPRSAEHRVSLPGGRECWVSVVAAAERDGAGRPVRLRGIAQDITARKQAEAALREANTTLEWRVQQRTNQLAQSERFSSGILDAMGAQLAVLDASGTIVATNRAWRLFGRTAGADSDGPGLGENYLEICDRVAADPEAGGEADDARSMGEGIRGVLSGRLASFAHEYPCDVGGARRWFVARVAPFTSDGPPMAVVTHDDVTLVHEAVERAEEGERVFASLSLASPVGVFRTGATGRCEYVNRRWCDLTGLAEADALGDGWVQALHPDDRARVARDWEAAAKAGSMFRSEYRFVQPGGRQVWVLGQAVPLTGPTGEATGMIGTLTEITDRKTIERAMHALATELISLYGQDYYDAALRRLVELTGADVAFVTRFDPLHSDELRTPVLLEFGQRRVGLSCPLAGTPCADVRPGAGRVVTAGLQAAYPTDARLRAWQAESYAGEALVDHSGRVLGTVALVYRRPLHDAETVSTILRLFAVAISAEIAQDRDRRRYEDLFEFAPSGLVLSDRQGRIVMVNRRAEELFGWDAAELVGQPIEVLVPPGSRAGHVQLRAAYQQDATRRTMAAGRRMLVAQHRNGSRFPVEIELAPVETEEGQMIAASVRDVSERVAADNALESARRHLEDTIESTAQAMILYDAEDRIALLNNHFRAMYPELEDVLRPGVPFETMLRAAVERGVLPTPADGDAERVIAERLAIHARADGLPSIRELPDGRTVRFCDYRSRDGGVVTVGTDITEQLAQEKRVREMQKMEAIGKLTGGMAHDFNNFLGVIIGSLDLLDDFTVGRPDARAMVESAREGAERAAELTRSLLAFARRQPLHPRPTDLRPHLESLGVLLSRTLGEDARLSLHVAPDLWPVMIDEAQFSSAIVNLANNARDAMPDGGELHLTAENVAHPDGTVDGLGELPPGDYVRVEVADSGIGIAPEMLPRIFEPFFTTKPAGHGTGLGLSMVYGFAQQSGGIVRVYSEVGHGTVVRMYLPRSMASGAARSSEPASAEAPRGHELILVVEDNDAIRRTVVSQLQSLGYQVLEAADGAAALRLLEERGDEVALVFSDVVMPGFPNGHELADLVEDWHPRTRILLTSGFPGDAWGRGARRTKRRLLSKPYRMMALAQAVRAAIDLPGADGDAGGSR